MHVADEAGADELFRDLHLPPKALVEADLKNDVAALASINHAPCRLDIDGERLLAQNVLSRISRGNYRLGVVAVRRGNDDGINVGRAEKGI